jgi:hypothetical protein
VQYDRRLSVRVPDTFPEDLVATASLEDSRVEGLDDRIPHQAIIAPANQRRSVESLGGDYAAVLLGVVELWLSQARPETARSRGVELRGPPLICLTWSAGRSWPRWPGCCPAASSVGCA